MLSSLLWVLVVILEGDELVLHYNQFNDSPEC